MKSRSKTKAQRKRQQAYWKAYHKKHRDALRTYQKQWYQDNKDRVKETQRLYREANADKVREGAASRYETNKGQWAKKRKAYYARNKKRILRAHRSRRAAYFAENPKEAWLHYTALGAGFRARKKGLPYDNDLSGLFLPDVCPVLGIMLKYVNGRGGPDRDSPSLDRRIPELGYVLSNLRVISSRANLLKSDATIDELKCVLRYVKECQKPE